MKKIIFALSVVAVMGEVSIAQDIEQMRKKFNDFKNQNLQEYTNFRSKCNKDYADFMRAAWEQYGSKPPVGQPAEEPPVIPPQPYVAPEEPKKDSKLEIVQHDFDEVIEVVRQTPKPMPPFPIVEKVPSQKPGEALPEMDRNSILKERIRQQQDRGLDTVPGVPAVPVGEENCFTFSFLGTDASVRIAPNQKVVLSKCKENAVADCWEKYSSGEYDNLIYDCLQLREKHNLCDWAYLAMLDEMSRAYYGSDANSATLMTAYIFCQSGYKMRLGMGDEGTRLVMLYASNHVIFDKPYFTLDDGENYYTFNYEGKSLHICKAQFPKEQPLSLLIGNGLMLDHNDAQERTLQSKQYSDAAAVVKVNRNLIDFYDNYPASMIGDNTMTRWAMYANTPLNVEIVDALYPSLRKSLEGKSEEEALNTLLNFVQTAFVYEYDNKVWGRDRVFFAEETLFYPYCDCEDRSILFSRLVRDLMGLDVLLVYYPGHLATAVKLAEKVSGDYIVLNGEHYIVCDPTYINAPIGETMPNMDNSKAKLIMLE